jgi:hypothetical protein
MRATYAARGGLTVTLERVELAAAEGAAQHDLTVWVRGIAAPFRVALPAAVVRLERDRLSIQAANGTAVYVPVGCSARPGCVRSGRLYLRPLDA